MPCRPPALRSKLLYILSSMHPCFKDDAGPMPCASNFGFVGERRSCGGYLRKLPDPLVALADVFLHGRCCIVRQLDLDAA